MDLAAFDEHCRLLGEALRARTVPRERRREARSLLQAGFLRRGDPDLEPEPATVEALEPLAEELSDLLIELKLVKPPAPFEPLTVRLAPAWPVQIRFAVRQPLLDRHQLTWQTLGDRMESVVDWFWERCQPAAEVTRELTVEEKALAEFVGEDLEYVWGRRKRRPPTTER